tara:strand:- start:544 stop:1029 length:486 start_codon:yes stop_codon:yes gene_type:complete
MQIPTRQSVSLDRDKLEMQQQVERLFMQMKALQVRANAVAPSRPLFGKRPGEPGKFEAWLRRRSRRYRRFRMRKNLAQSGLFDAAWYLRRYPDVGAAGVNPVDHYLMHGASEMRDPSPYFSTASYLLMYPDVRASGINPLLHYLQFGYDELRHIMPSTIAP